MVQANTGIRCLERPCREIRQQGQGIARKIKKSDDAEDSAVGDEEDGEVVAKLETEDD